MPTDHRHSPRVPLDCPLSLTRRRGAPVSGHTEDVGPGGARVIVERPLGIDEEVGFELMLDGVRLDGRARVVRQQSPRCYALRFEALDRRASEALLAAAAR
jgi:PilZ domain-containing protein